LGTADLSERRLRVATGGLGAAVAAVGAAALAGWAAGLPALRGIRASYIPMAPNTALAFVALGAALLAGGGGRGRRLAGAVGAIVAAVAALRLAETLAGVDLAVDRWFLRVPAARFGLAEVGRMSLPTASAFVASGAAMAVLGLARGRIAGDLAGAGGLAAGMTGLVFALGYLFSPDAPLLYGTRAIPMALNTALGFVGLGAGLVTWAGQGAFPLRRLSGPSTRARLLRVFLPLVVATVGGVAWLTHFVTTNAGASSAAITSAALAAASILLFGVICERIARRTGAQIERAEAELQQAHDELEVKVEERTRELTRANAILNHALRELRESHEALQKSHVELRQAQGRMLQQARMASLGQTAAGVAHEINNPLAFVTNNLFVLGREVADLHEILRLYQEAEATLAEYRRDLHARITARSEEVDLPFLLDNLGSLLERSRGGLLRIQKIVQGLRDFAHLDEADSQEADLNAGVVTTVDLMRPLAEARRVALGTDLAPLPRLTCSPGKINLVIQSLVSNAIDASPPGGRVVVRTRPDGDGAEIEVSDDGPGIDPAIRDRVFDPFFTTKPVGRGTGLGLAISYGIVKDHGGAIDFESAPGRGTRFVVRLPRAPACPAAPGGIAAAAGDGHAGQGP
jgi:two-component system NtrC family sensor kinase